jgi:hypothetical protein
VKKKTYDKPLIRAIQLKLHHVLLNTSPNGQTEDINEQQDWEKEGDWI